MSLPPMKYDEAKDFISLLSDSRFEDFMKRMARLDEQLKDEIMLSTTESDRREALVLVHDIVKHEILELPKAATKVIQNAGQVQAPAPHERISLTAP